MTAIDSKTAGCLPDSSGRVGVRELVLEHYEDAYRYAYRLSGNAADAEDLVQQAFLTAHRKIDQVRDISKLRSWLLTVLRSCFLKSHRRQRPLTGIDLQVDQIPEQGSRETSIDREKLQNAIGELPESQRVVLMMFYFDEMSYQEMAAELGVAIGTIMSRLSRAKGNLRSRLIAAGGMGDDGDAPSSFHSEDNDETFETVD